MVAAGNSRKELDTMKSRIILNRERTAKAQEISIPIHGKGGELGIKAVTGLVGLIETLKDCGTCQEVQSVFDLSVDITHVVLDVSLLTKRAQMNLWSW